MTDIIERLKSLSDHTALTQAQCQLLGQTIAEISELRQCVADTHVDSIKTTAQFLAERRESEKLRAALKEILDCFDNPPTHGFPSTVYEIARDGLRGVKPDGIAME